MNADLKQVLEDAITELTQQHAYINMLRKEPCPDRGPFTCPTWNVIHRLRDQLKRLAPERS